MSHENHVEVECHVEDVTNDAMVLNFEEYFVGGVLEVVVDVGEEWHFVVFEHDWGVYQYGVEDESIEEEDYVGP